MPSSITHELIATEAQKRLPAAMQSIVESAPAAYFLGAQGPDPFFFATAKGEGVNFGKFLHRNAVYELFSAFQRFLEALPAAERAVPLAYCLGYVTHYCADVAFHPCVYRYMQQNKLRKREHQRIENDWDVYFARKIAGKEAENYSFPAVVKLENDVKPLWKYASAELGRKIPHGAMRSALTGFSKYLRFFHRRCYSSQRRWARFDKLFHIRALSCLYPSRSPDQAVLEGERFEQAANMEGLPPVKTADDLFERAVSQSVYRMMLFYDHIGGMPLPREQFDRHLLTGQHIPDKKNDRYQI